MWNLAWIWVLTYSNSFVRSWVRNRAIFCSPYRTGLVSSSCRDGDTRMVMFTIPSYAPQTKILEGWTTDDNVVRAQYSCSHRLLSRCAISSCYHHLDVTIDTEIYTPSSCHHPSSRVLNNYIVMPSSREFDMHNRRDIGRPAYKESSITTKQ